MDSRKFRGPTLTTYFFFFFFLVDEGMEDPSTTISWRADDGPTLNAGLVVW